MRDRRDHGHRAVGHVGRVPPAAHADLDHRDVHRGVRERGEHHAGEHLEEGQRRGLLVVDQLDVGRDLLVELDEALGGQRHAVDADPLPHRDQVRRGEPPGAQPALAQQRLDHPGRRRLAVGAGDVHDRERAVRVAEQADQRRDPVEGRVDLVLRPPRPDLELYLAQPLACRHVFSLLPQVVEPVLPASRAAGLASAGSPGGRCPPRPPARRCAATSR